VAKLKGPLMSLGASGKLANTLVFFNWKGINAVREYVIPANPDTTLQGLQRGKLATMVAAIHTAQAHDTQPLTSADQVAYSALAAAKGRIITWFNQAVKLGIDALVNDKAYTVWRWGSTLATHPEDTRFVISVTDDGATQCLAGKFYLGTSKTNLIHSRDAEVEAGIFARLIHANRFTGLTSGKKYYWQFRPASDDPAAGSNSGIYHFVAD